MNWVVNLTNPAFSCITFVDIQKGWAAGYNGIIYSSVLTGINQIGTEVPIVIFTGAKLSEPV